MCKMGLKLRVKKCSFKKIYIMSKGQYSDSDWPMFNQLGRGNKMKLIKCVTNPIHNMHTSQKTRQCKKKQVHIGC